MALPFAVNLVANLLFMPIFAGLRSIPLVAADIVIMWATLVWWVVAVWPHARWVALAQVPNFKWVQQRKNPPMKVRLTARLEDIPNVGPAVAGDLRQLGITSPGDLPGRDPYPLFDDQWRITGQRHDPCVLDTFIAAVRYMEGVPQRPWWKYTAERKRAMAARSEAGG